MSDLRFFRFAVSTCRAAPCRVTMSMSVTVQHIKILENGLDKIELFIIHGIGEYNVYVIKLKIWGHLVSNVAFELILLNLIIV